MSETALVGISPAQSKREKGVRQSLYSFFPLGGKTGCFCRSLSSLFSEDRARFSYTNQFW